VVIDGVDYDLSKVKNATIRNMTLKDGKAQYGGGIWFRKEDTTLHLYDLIISGNTYESTGSGGGISIYGITSTVEVERCRVINNTSCNGGGIGLGDGTLMLSDCEISGNIATLTGGYGGGIYTNGGTIVISSVEVSGNTALTGGGIAVVYAGVNVLAVRGKIINNTAVDGGGMWTMGNTTIFSSCEISGNTAEERGGITCQGGKMTNCLICNNKATVGYTGGLACNTFPMELINCTITSNEAHIKFGGVVEGSSGVTLEVVNCIVWGNTDSVGIPEIGTDSGGIINVTYSDVRGGYGSAGDHNVDIDPKFVSVSDLHLTSSSPTGVTQGGTTEGAPACDHDGNLRTVPYSMGAYEKN
jgi:hypothetical protein